MAVNSGNTGLLWFSDGLNAFGTRMSVAADELQGSAQDVVEEVLDHAKTAMQEIVNEGGINRTKKGGPRRLSDAMYNSIGAETTLNTRGRVAGKFGFINDPPEWTPYQELGTQNADGTSRIPAMLAYVTVQKMVEDEFSQLLTQGAWLPPSLRNMR